MIHPRWLIVAPIVALTAALGVARSPAVKISGVVFDDVNRNGTRDAGERGVAGVAVSNQDTVVTTDASGAFRLPGQGTGVVFVSTPIARSVHGGVRRIPRSCSPSLSRENHRAPR